MHEPDSRYDYTLIDLLRRECFMPSKSAPQRRLMAAAAHNPSFAKKVGVPQSVAKEFNRADKRAKPPPPKKK